MQKSGAQTKKIIPVVIIDDIGAAEPLAETLCEAGITTLEITLRTPNALAIIAHLAKKCPDIEVGAGTIRNPQDFVNAVNAGAKYIIAPGVTNALLETAMRLKDQALFIPGVVTPSQAMECAERGLTKLKFFPAEPYNAYGVIKALGSPLPDISFCPTGGVTLENMTKYLALSNIFAVGLSSIVDSKLIEQHNFGEISSRARRAQTLLLETL